MKSKKTYNINNQLFNTKTAIIKYVQSILYSYVSGRSLSKLDETFILSLLEYHPNKDEKIGIGVERIEVRKNPPKHKGFWIIRKDGTQIDFSYLVCINGSSTDGDIRQVARNEVKPFVLQFKQEFFQNNCVRVCPITGEEISFTNSHVHHSERSFDELFIEFFGKIDLEKIGVVDSFTINKLFADRSLAKEWHDFHNTNADLQVVSVIANLSILEKGNNRGKNKKVKTGGIKLKPVSHGETDWK